MCFYLLSSCFLSLELQTPYLFLKVLWSKDPSTFNYRSVFGGCNCRGVLVAGSVCFDVIMDIGFLL